MMHLAVTVLLCRCIDSSVSKKRNDLNVFFSLSQAFMVQLIWCGNYLHLLSHFTNGVIIVRHFRGGHQTPSAGFQCSDEWWCRLKRKSPKHSASAYVLPPLYCLSLSGSNSLFFSLIVYTIFSSSLWVHVLITSFRLKISSPLCFCSLCRISSCSPVP